MADYEHDHPTPGGSARIAITGMACRFAGAADLAAFWRLLLEGQSGLRELSEDALLAAGVPAGRLEEPSYVRVNGSLALALAFDAGFFGYPPEEAALLDPQHRVFLEACWHALEDAGMDTAGADRIGIYGGVGFNSYLLSHIAPDLAAKRGLERWRIGIGNDKDTVTSRVAYKLGLNGPAVTVQSACSTSLVAVHVACQAILDGECEVALAGGASVHFPLGQGYSHFAEGIEASDGVCRPFSPNATGTVFADGVGVVVLRRYEDAVAAGDRIYAVICGSAVNNDADAKVGFTAPGVAGQVEVVRAAHAAAGLCGDDIDYVEAHGTGTAVGDRIECTALEQAFGSSSGERCLLGSVKGNVGHADAAAGVAGLIKVVLSLHHEVLPASLHADTAPATSLPGTRLRICNQRRAWTRTARPRRAGVSSFGIGGTNAHVVLEETPLANGRPSDALVNGRTLVFPLAAPDRESLRRHQEQLEAYCSTIDAGELAGAARTMQSRKRHGPWRSALLLEASDAGVRKFRIVSAERAAAGPPPVALMIRGDSIDVFGAGAAFLAAAPGFRPHLDDALSAIGEHRKEAVRRCLHGHVSPGHPAADAVIPKLAAFAYCCALVRYCMSMGIAPRALAGDWLGERVAVAVAGMLSVEEAASRLAGSLEAAGAQVHGRADRHIAEHVRPAQGIPVMSARTGAWLSPDDVTVAAYWSMPSPSLWRDGDGLAAMTTGAPALWVELGLPGDAVKAPAAPNLEWIAGGIDGAGMMRALAELWVRGVHVRWSDLLPITLPKCWVPLYPFERRHIEYVAAQQEPRAQPSLARALQDTPVLAHLNWLRRTMRLQAGRMTRSLLCVTRSELPAVLATRLAEDGTHVIWQHAGAERSCGDDRRRFDFADRDAWNAAWKDCDASCARTVLYLDEAPEVSSFEDSLTHALNFAGSLAAFLSDQQHPPTSIHWITSGLLAADGRDVPQAERAALWGPARVLPQEVPGVTSRLYDLAQEGVHSDAVDDMQWRRLLALVAEQSQPAATEDGGFASFALRGAQVLVPRFDVLPATQASALAAPVLRRGGTYLVVGGSGGVGRALVAWLAKEHEANVLVCGRRPREDIHDWEAFVQQHPRVSYVQADVRSEQQLRAIGAKWDAGLQHIHGVFHCAGLAGAGTLLGKDVAQAVDRSRAKVQGARALCRAFASVPLDFMLLFGSTNGWMGGIGQAEYSSANRFLDTLVQSAHMPWRMLSIAWDTWLNTGMARWERSMGRAAATPSEASANGAERVQLRLPRESWLFSEHAVDDVALLPGMAHVALLLRGTTPGIEHPAHLQDVIFHAPVLRGEQDQVTLSLSLPHAQGGLDVRDAAGKPMCSARSGPLPTKQALPAELWSAFVTGQAGVCDVIRPERLRVGPRWGCVQAVMQAGSAYRVDLDPAPVAADFDEWPFHPALLDLALLPVQMGARRFSVPVSVEKLVAYAPLRHARHSFVTLRQATEQETQADVWVTDARGGLLLTMSGVRFAALEPGLLRMMAMADDAFVHGLAAAEALKLLAVALDTTAVETLMIGAAAPDRLAELVEQRAQRYREQYRRTETGGGEAAFATTPQARVQALCAIVAEHLGYATVAPEDRFFALGGDSLSGLLVIESARQAGMQLTLASLYRAQSIAELAELAQRSAEDPPAADTVPFDLISEETRARLPASAVDAFPLSRLQEGMRYFRARFGSTDIYRDVLWCHVEGRLDRVALEAAWTACVERHPVLRTTIDMAAEDEPLQVVHAQGRTSVGVEDLAGRPLADWMAAVGLKSRYPAGQAVYLFALADGARFYLLFLLDDAMLDGWSATSLMAELLRRYGSALDGQVLPASPTRLGFGDYVRHEREAIASAELQTFWRAALEDCIPSRFASSAPGTAQSIPDIAIHAMPFHSAGHVDEMAQQHGVAAKIVLLAAYLKALSCWCGTLEVTTGLETHTRLETEGGTDVLGLHLNTLPLRHRFSAMTVARYLAAIHAADAAAITHRHLPLSEIQRHWAVPLFDNCFNYTHFRKLQDAAEGGALGGRLRLLDYFGEEKTHYPFKLWVDHEATSGVYRLYVAYDRQRVSHAQVEAFAGHFDAVLAALAEDAQRDIMAIAPPASSGHGWHGPAEPFASLDSLLRQVWRQPEHATAVRLASETHSYGELSQAADRVCHRLRDLGCQPGTVVGITLPRSFRWVAAMLGVLRAGATILLLDAQLPAVRLADMRRQAAPAFAVTDGDQPGSLEILPVAAAARPIAGQDAPLRTGLDDLAAYLVFTSGSTGVPKGVQGTRRGLANRIAWHLRHQPIGPGDIYLSRTAQSFVDLFFELFGPLCAGATLALATDADCRDAQRIAGLLREHGATHMVIVPTLLGAVLEQLGQDAAPLPLRHVSVSGEMLPSRLLKRAQACLPAVTWLNIYGSSEIAADVTVFDASGHEPDETGSIAVGLPIANVSLYLLDANLDLVADGDEGELYVSGAALAAGYLGQPAQSAWRFLPNPFAKEPDQSRMFRTGDVARRVAGGLMLVGRSDRQVKIRGVRIDLDGVETRLEGIAGVRRAAVIARDAKLAGYLELEPAVAVQTLWLALRTGFSPEDRPGVLWQVERMPLTATGKVDRGALETVAAQRLQMIGEPLQGATETTLAQLWCQLLPGAAVYADSDFNELGGHSLLLLQLAGAIQRRFACRVAVAPLLASPRLRDQARLIDAAAGVAQASSAWLPDHESSSAPFAPTTLQQAYWAARHRHGGGSHMFQEWEVPHLDTQRLAQAWARLVARHGMLRARVNPDGLLWIEEQPASAPGYTDLRSQAPEAREAALLAWRETHAFSALDAQRGPLYLLHVFQLADEQFVLAVKLDFIAADAWSMGVLAQELWALYAEPQHVLPALEVSFRDILLHARRSVPADDAAGARDYWIRRLPGFPDMPDLPVRKQPSEASDAMHRRQLLLDAGQARALASVAERIDVSISSLLTAAYAAVLQRWSTRKAFALTLTLFDRPFLHPQVNRVVGDFTSVVWLQVEGSAAASFEAFARGLHRRLMEDLDHRGFSGVDLLREARRQSLALDPSRYVFTYIPDIGGGAAAFPAGTRERYRVTRTAGVWIDNQVVGEAGRLRLHWDCVDAVFPAGLLDDMFDAYGKLVMELVDWAQAPTDGLADTPRVRLPAAQVARRAGDRSAGYAELDYMQDIAAACASDPLAPAVIDGDTTLSYQRLWALAAGLAARLRISDPSADCVAVHMAPGWRYVVAVLATQLAGMAYVPLSMQWPRLRVCDVIAGYGIDCVICDVPLNDWDVRLSAVQCLSIDGGTQAVAMAEHDICRFAPARLAYVMFTSGSTGEPKGVMMKRGAVMNTLRDMTTRLRMDRRDRVLALSDPGFDLSVFDLLAPLMVGGATVFPDAAAQLDPARWWHTCRLHAVTIWNSAPALFDLLADYAGGKREQLGTLGLRWVMLSGDWIGLQVPAAVRELAPRARLLSLGGATEAGIWSVSYPVAAVHPEWLSIPYGRPLQGQYCDVVDSLGASCPDWVTGELTIAGGSLSDGYWQRPQLTANAYYVDAATHERRYRTGDLARYRNDGTLELIGRMDQQVKIRGQRIECAEVEHALGSCPGVRKAIVLAVKGRDGNARLHAVVDCESGVPTEAIRDHCAQRLPERMVPTRWHRDIAVPLNSNGKIDRRALLERIESALAKEVA